MWNSLYKICMSGRGLVALKPIGRPPHPTESVRKRTLFNNQKGNLCINERSLEPLNCHRQKHGTAPLEETAQCLVILIYRLGVHIILWTIVFWHNASEFLVSKILLMSTDVWILGNRSVSAWKPRPMQLLAELIIYSSQARGWVASLVFSTSCSIIFPNTYIEN